VSAAADRLATGRDGAAVAVPFSDLAAQHAPLTAAILADITALIERSEFGLGETVARFEDAFAAFAGARHCVAVSSGMDALALALVAVGVERGDDVLVPAHTFVATFEAVSAIGARPVPVDVARNDLNLDPAGLAVAATPRTTCVVPVHLYGQMAAMGAIGREAARLRLAVIEDACQAHGAERDGQRAGAAGAAAAFSFYPGKNLGAMGDAGALTTDDDAVAASVRELRNHGERGRYVHVRPGYTARLDAMQAAVLLRKLPRLRGWNAARARAAAYYTEAFRDVAGVAPPAVAAGSRPAWHLYELRCDDAARMAAGLAERGIVTGRHYPEPPHLSAAYRHLGYGRGDFPVAEALARELVSLPLFPTITRAQQDRVVEAVRDVAGG
jgi:dTDP-4-amino-4,6-dideoxygalactose transaminase